MRTAHAVVGRADELASIARALDAGALPAVVVLEGEPGIGKTTLWSEGVRAARERGWCVLTSSPSPAEAELALAGITDLIGTEGRRVLRSLPAPQRSALSAALLIGGDSSISPDARTLSAAFLSAVRALAAERPVLLAVDDVQWMDGASARVLAFALRRLGDERVLGLFARRSAGEGAALIHQELRRALEERGGRLPIGPLDLAAFQTLLRDRLAFVLPGPPLRQVHTMSAGNPLVALEMARAMLLRGDAHDPDRLLPMPASAEDLVAERLTALPNVTRDALVAVAAQREPTMSACAAVLPDADLDAVLRPALLAGVLADDGDRLRFTHPLLGVAAYARADGRRRRAVHASLATAAPTLEERARHLALATDTPDERVASVLEEASASAAARGAPDAAASLLELSIRLTPADLAEHADRRALLAASHYLSAGDVARVRALAGPLVARLPAGSPRARAALVLAWATEDWQSARLLCEQAVADAADDLAAAASAHYHLAFGGLVAGVVEDGRRHAAAALDLATDEPTVAMHLATVVLLESLGGHPVGDEVARRALALEARHPAMPTHYPPSVTCGLRAMYADRLDEARRLFAAAERRITERGDEYMFAGVRLHQTELEVRAGQWERAAAYADEGLVVTERATTASRQSALLYAQALVAARRGRVEEVRAVAARGLELALRTRIVIFELQFHAVLGFLELSLGDGVAADAHLRPLPEALARAGFGEPSLCPALPDAIDALLLMGEPDLARAFTARLEEQAASVGSVWARALAWRCRGQVAAADGALADALAHFESALAEDLPEPFERGRTLLAYGTALRRAKRRGQARERLGEALAAFEGLGAPLWAAKARAELARVGGRRADVALTPTERHVADLVARGLSNPEVAARLMVSRRAVEANLTRIYAKLGLRSRTELARHVARERSDQ